MKALITGASSGIGREMARQLAQMGIDVILVARRMGRLQELKEELPGRVQIIRMDLADEASCRLLYERVKPEEIDILINNAGFGVCGSFAQSDLERELEMINVNIKAVHILTKLFLRDFIERDSGYILNVASSAAFLPGPLMAAYYAGKAYVLRLSEAIYGELKRCGSHVRVTALCPGPVRTEFNRVADVEFIVRGLSAEQVAQAGIEGMLRGKRIVVPGLLMQCGRFVTRVLPTRVLLRASYFIQHQKQHQSR